MPTRLVRIFLICSLVLGAFAQPALADRVPYGGTQDFEARGTTVMVRHHHDWSKIPMEGEGFRLAFGPDTPFGVDQEVSSLEFYSPEGALIAEVPSPPLTYLEISADGRYVIGLSSIKHLNPAQLVVFDSKGELLLRRRISAHVFCFDTKKYEEVKSRHRKAFLELAHYSQVVDDSYGWRDGDNVYLDIRGGVSEPYRESLWKDLWPALCESPLSPNFGESTSNRIRWFHAEDPRPRVVERDGRPYEVRLRDPEGIEFGVKFELTPLEP